MIAPAGGGAETRLEPRLMDLLLLFAGSGGRVLSKDEIVAAVWDGRAIGDDTLAAVVSRLRRALGETSELRYIETLPKRGYRLLVGAPTAPIVTSGSRASELTARGEAAMTSPLGLAQARLYFEAAVAADHTYAPAHAGYARALIAQHQAGGEAALLIAAKSEARQAVALDAGSAAGWTALGFAILLADRDFALADGALQRAIAAAPGLAAPHLHRAFALTGLGKFVEAERACRRALELEPVSLATHGGLVQILICARRYRHAVAAAEAAIRLAPASSEAWYGKGWALVLAGDEGEGVKSLLKGLELWGVPAAAIRGLRGRYDSEGFRALCAAGADLFSQPNLMFTPKITDIALLRAGAGDADAAFAALDIAADQDDAWLLVAPYLPHLDALRADPRFERLLGRVRRLK